MDAQLEILLQIQDLKAQRRELLDGGGGRDVQVQQFNLDADTAIADLQVKIGELESDLDAGVRKRYDWLSSGMDRVVAPALNGTCYGCFVSVPTAVASDPAERKGLRACDHCGRFLYFVR